MKNYLGAVVATSLMGSFAVADIWYDPEGDIANVGDANLDMTSLEVTDDGINAYVTLTVADLSADWGSYMLFIDLPGLENFGYGSGDNDNPWGRDVSGLAGTDFFVGSGSWGSEFYHNFGGQWNLLGDGGFGYYLSDWDTANNSITWTLSGIVSDSEFYGFEGVNFEVGTTGGNWGDPAIDLFGGEGVQPGWGQGSASTDWTYYEFSYVPGPGALALLGIAGLVRRRRQ